MDTVATSKLRWNSQITKAGTFTPSGLLLSGATSHFAGDFRFSHVGMCQK